ncbi:hypothetical protein M8J75_012958 [Diaphorina citri]|nr:hypothetical protein M8J75_012958 [Diaphorina citri]KAI5753722.1 hypothetical protein M8J77_002814 [Diaphorina citri]
MFFVIPTLLLVKTPILECAKIACLATHCSLRFVNSATDKNKGANYSATLNKKIVPSYIPKMAKTFCLDDYDAIGFDLDNTLATYNLKNLLEMEYNCLAEYLVEEKGYKEEVLMKPFNEKSTDFIQRGLIVDSQRGNLLKLDYSGKIVKVAHGLSFLTPEDIKKTYGEHLTWEVTNEFVKDFLATWNGPLSEKMRTFLDYFDMPASLIFARAVEEIDKQNDGRPVESYTVYNDIVDGFNFMFTPAHFAENKGKFFPLIKQHPDKYYKKCSHVLEWLKELKAKNKILFVLTGSYIDFANHTATTCLGDDWKQYFDFIGYFSKKPGFFTGVNRPFLRLNNLKEKDEILSTELKSGQCFSQGNWDGLIEAMKKSLNKTDIKPLYIGDNFIQDLYTPSKYTHCDTVAVCEEQSAEGFHTKEHPDSSYLKSNLWDSYFYTSNSSEGKTPTIWSDILKKHCKICVPSISYLASEPINKKYSTFNDEDSNFSTDGFYPTR